MSVEPSFEKMPLAELRIPAEGLQENRHWGGNVGGVPRSVASIRENRLEKKGKKGEKKTMEGGQLRVTSPRLFIAGKHHD